MTDALEHRGPDDDGFYLNQTADGGSIGLGHRRLSIIDLGSGKQPITNEDRTVWVILNGEIYNYRELRKELVAKGHVFQTHSDTEVIVHLYEEHGSEFVQYLNGMFAIALWDQKKNKLTLVRDRLGQKPLFYSMSDDQICFASQIRALHTVKKKSSIHRTGLDSYFRYGYVHGPQSIFTGVSRLEPAHLLEFEPGKASNISRYWTPQIQSVPESIEEQRDQLDQKMRTAVERRLVSDVPVGAFLSGGIDSTIVVGMAKECYRSNLQAFTIGFENQRFDESKQASAIAKHLGVSHIVEKVDASDPRHLLEIVRQFDEPFSDSSAIPMYFVSKLARASLKVALSGDAGDELFLGYGTYKTFRIMEMLDHSPKFVWPILKGLGAGPAGRIFGSKKLAPKMQSLATLMQQSYEQRYLNENRVFTDDFLGEIYTAGKLEQEEFGFSPQAVVRVFRELNRDDSVTAASWADLHSYLPGDILTKVDTMSMAHGLECRSPFLDHELVEYALSLPRRSRFRWLKGKRILKESFHRYFPDDVLQAKKQGFSIPLASWFRNEWKPLLCDYLLSANAKTFEFVKQHVVESMVSEHLAGTKDTSTELWNLLALEIWLQDHFP